MRLTVRSEVEIVDPSEVPIAVRGITTDQFFQFAVATVLIYDAIITMDREIKYFWMRSMNIVNLVYFLIRYLGILGVISLLLFDTFQANIHMCLFSGWTREMTSLITVIAIDYVLMIRVLALYSQDVRLSICLKTILLIEAILKLVAVIFVMREDEFGIVGLSQDVTVCVANAVPQFRWAILDWVIPLSYGFVLMLLATYKAAEYWKANAGLEGFPLIKVLIYDQIIYFFLVAFCCAMNVVQFKIEVSNDYLAGILQVLGNPSFLCVLGSRMLFNLKEAGERGVNEGTSYRMEDVSEMRFA